MEPVIFVELLGRRGQVERRVRVDRFPVLVGRAYTCDLILDDRYVCPEHARLELDASGQVVLRDLGSRNGIQRTADASRVDALPVLPGEEVRLGRSVLRFRSRDELVAPALVDSRQPAWLRWSTSTGAALSWLALVGAISSWQLWRANYAAIRNEQALETLLALLAWTGIWALLGRLLIHASRFAAHCAAACSYWLAWTLFSGALDYARFALPSIGGVQRLQLLGQAALTGLLVCLHLQLATGLGRRARTLASSAVLLLVWGGTELQNRQDPDFWVRTLPYWSQLEPIDTAWLPAESPEQFFAGTAALEDELAALAERDEP
jgi:pSer/pThr/pTyr-binding forkhead associated (FHA) protein